MTPTEINLVKDSFRKIAPIADQAAALFYARLFELDPSLRPLFRGDMAEQGRKLMTMIATAVASLDRVDTIVPALRQLGARHATYQVTDEHYATVGAALLWTLEKGLGGAFTQEVRAAWTDTYTLLANTMLEATRQARAAACAA
jgi:hemoglobin-like flavoprotein